MRNLLLEMAVYSENDVFLMNPVASVSTKVTDKLEGEELRKYVLHNFQSVGIQPNYKIDEHIVGELISHHCGHRQRKKAALLALPYVINANFVTAPWRRRLGDDGQPVRKNDKRPSGMISAPILIDGIKCLCSLTLRKSKGIITPYSLVLKDEDGKIIEGEKMEGTISSVPHSSSKPTAIGDAYSSKATTSHDTNPSFQGAKIQQNIETTKDNNIKTENKYYKSSRYMKRTIKLTESDLHRIIKESVKKVLRESNIPKYEQPVFIDCSSPNDADCSVEIGYSDYSSSLFYVGECGTDGYAALEAVVEYLKRNNIIDHYTADEELVSEYPDDFIYVNGFDFDITNIVIHQLVGNHGGRRR